MNGEGPRDRALHVVSRLPLDSTFIPVQVLGELFGVLVRKAGRSRLKARDAVLAWHDTFPTIETSSAVMIAGASLAAEHRLGIWDAVILAASAAAGCRLLLSEDLHDGFTWAGVSVANPMARKVHPLLAAIIDEA